MNETPHVTLARAIYDGDGIFSALYSSKFLYVALEHSYMDANSIRPWYPKIPAGIYTCRRSKHMLPWGGTSDDPFIKAIDGEIVVSNNKYFIRFDTFEITGVTGHTNLLFHWGNYDDDSDGCVLVGRSMKDEIVQSITNSRETFIEFMKHNAGIDLFTLEVRS